MPSRPAKLEKIENAIRALSREEQKILLTDLPRLLDLSADDIALLKAAETAFNFWDNSEDSIYDSL